MPSARDCHNPHPHPNPVADRSLWPHCLVLAMAVADLSTLLPPDKVQRALTAKPTGYTLHMCLRVTLVQVRVRG